ncbi:response regulator transcription factor [Umezawaea endophytica]|uniref:response regulator transcription factor n=1 Tax=Umezawaea endophytica TaxID=1654476 RepID=UPI0027E22FB2|nr:LuxR C-terminal-related transcriptional regulator [Umezawaea endophytica]
MRLLEHVHDRRTRDDAAADRLSGQEAKVVTRVARGWTNNEVAADLNLSLSTVKTHLGRIQDKLSLRNRVEIAAWAWEHGIVR